TTFESLLNFDCKRAELSDEFTLACGLFIENLNEFSTAFGGYKKQSLIKEITREIQGEMTELDYLTLTPNGIFIWTHRAIEEDENNLHQRIAIDQRIKKLVFENFNSFELKTKFYQTDLQGGKTAGHLMQSIKNQLTNE
ncbi:MAG: hypothetical protein RL609_1345, partial [Bacteroidota bacterium]